MRFPLQSLVKAACFHAVLVFFATVAAAQTTNTWIGGASGTFNWSNTANWSTGVVPNATDSRAIFTTPLTNTGVAWTNETVTLGSIVTSNSSGNVVIGTTAVSSDALNLATSSGAPTIDIATGGTLFMFADIIGNQGFTKIGGGVLTFRFNNSDHAFTGNVNINAGTLAYQRDGTFGNTTNGIVFTGSSVLMNASSVAGGAVTLNTDRTITINTNVTATFQNSAAANTTTINGVVAGAGNLIVAGGNGSHTFNGANTYSGSTLLSNSAKMTLGAGAMLSTNSLVIAGSSGAILNLGGTAQSVRNLAMSTTNSVGGTQSITNGSLTVNGASDQSFGATISGSVTDLAGLTAFTYNAPNNSFGALATGANVSNTVNLASGANTITATNIRLGSGGANVSGQMTVLKLGQTNVWNAGTDVFLGNFQGNADISFLGGLTNPNLTVRGISGGSSAVPIFRVANTSSGNQATTATLDLTGGSLDLVATEMDIAVNFTATANTASTGTLTMPAGSVEVGTLSIARRTTNGTAGNPVITGTLNQSGGSVTADTVVIGNQGASGGTPTLTANYNLTGGTLAAGSITAIGTGVNAASVRNLNLNGGTVRNKAGSDLTITGAADTSSGRLNVVLGASGGTFEADNGRNIAVGANALVSGSGNLTKAGNGTLTLGSGQTYTGRTTVNAGTVTISADNSLGAAPGSTVSNQLTLNGGTLATSASFALAASRGISLGAGGGTFQTAGMLTNASVISGSGALTKSGDGTLVLSGANTYTGATTIGGGGVTLGTGAAISTNTVTFTGVAGVVLNLGGNSQSVGLVNNNLSNSVTTLAISNGSLAVTGTADQTLGATVNGSGTDLSGLNGFSFNGASRTFQINANGANVTNTVQLSKLGTNTISAANVRWGGGVSNVVGQNSLVRLGQDNVINAGSELLVGFFQGSGNASFAEGITNGTLTVRGAGGGSAAAPLIRVGQGNSGNQSTVGVLNLTGGSIDALASEFDVGVHAANASGTTGSGTLTMPAGNIVAGTMSLGRKTATTGSATATGTVNQSGGTVTATNLYLGNSAASGADLPNLVADYNLTGGTLYAQTIGGNGANYGASTVRNLNVNGGTVQNIAGSDLTINGLANTASGRINVVLGNSGGAFLAEVGRSITIGGNALVSGSGGLAKQGGGTLTLATNNTYTGATTVEEGTLVVNGSLVSSAVTVESGGTLGGSGSLGLTTIEEGGTISPGNSPGTLTLTNGLDWNAGGHYNWQIFDATGTAGTGWDLIDITGGSWDINGLSTENPFNINLWSLSATNPDSSGVAVNFNAAQTYSWKILAATNISGTFNTNLFTINTGAFNGTAGFAGASGLFSLALDGNNDLFLNYAPGAQAVPEPGTWAAAAVLVAAGYARWRRRRAVSQPGEN